MKTLEQYKLEFALNDKMTAKNGSEKLILELIEEVANDRNSSMFREDVTKLMVGLKPSKSKLGYDDDFEAIEVKPVNFTGGGKLDGKGNFSDFTWKRHHKYLKDNVRMLVSGFSNGKLLFIAEFPYKTLQDRIVHILKSKLPHGDMKGVYVRNAAFNYKHWMGGPYTIKYVRPNIGDYQKIFNKKFYTLLTETTNA